VEHNVAFGNSCLAASGNLVFHMDTVSVVKDFEAVRLALGGEQFNFFGFSYGSQIAYTYADLFPDSFRAIVGDAILNHAGSETSSLVTEAATYEDQLDQFLQW
jgi:pimeloyl-ACP methyl ester carboxylesterase